MHRVCAALVSVLVVAFLASCGTIIHGTGQDVSVNSVPSDVSVTVVGRGMTFKTPAVVELKRKWSNTVLRFEKDGYEPVELALHRKVDGWIAGNIIFGGVIGLVVDFANGAAYKLSPDNVMANLPKEGPEQTQDGALVIVVELDPSVHTDLERIH